jgi:hypothetical protein
MAALNARPSGWRPSAHTPQKVPAPACTSSGITGASAPKIASWVWTATAERPLTATGGRQLRTEPSGATTSTGSNSASLAGISGTSAALSATNVLPRV